MNSYAPYKRALDVVGAAVGLLLLSPVLLLTALAVRLFLGQPVLFRQRRPGRAGRPFTILKFRTMTDARDASGKLLPDAARLNGFGRFLRASSLDELPELINVLRGEMSFVGPRPLLTQYLERYTPAQARRHDVTPGLTGLAQVSGRNALGWERRLRLDAWYAKNASLALDLRILWRTLGTVVTRRGVSAPGHATVAEFGGDGRIAVIGAGGHAKVVISLLRAAGFGVEGVYDDDAARHGTSVLDVPVLGAPSLLDSRKRVRAVIAVGSNEARARLAARLSRPGMRWISAVHPRAYVHESAKLAPGALVFAGAIVQPGARIGAHAIVNTSASVDHDCEIGAFVHVAPGARLAGEVRVGEGSLIGCGASIIPGRTVGDWSTVGAGATVIRAVATRSLAIGVPAVAKPLAQPSPSIQGSTMKELVPMSLPEIDESDIQAVTEVLRSGRLALGPRTLAFEAEIARQTGTRHAIAVSSGTAALHLIVKSMGIGPGDEVLVPSFTFAASVNAILFEGARPVWVDIEPETCNLDPADLERKLTPRTRAILAVDVFGHPVDWDRILPFAQRHGLRIIDDSCEALGARYRDRPVGSFGDAATFAFYPNKQITTGEGGMIVTSDDELARLCRSYRNQGRDEMGQWLHHARIGYNYRMSELGAALGLSQLRRLDRFTEKRAHVAAMYTERLTQQAKSDGDSFVTAPRPLDGVKMSWFVYVVRLVPGIDRDEVITGLERRGIPARSYFTPIHTQPYIRELGLSDAGTGGLPVTDAMARRTLALPFHNNLSESEVERVVAALTDAIAEVRGAAVRRSA